MPLANSGSDADISADIKELMATGRPQTQAVAIAMRVNGRPKKPAV